MTIAGVLLCRVMFDDFNISRHILDRLCVVGVNYDKANVEVRGAFSVNDIIFNQIAEAAKLEGIRSMFILSTCNRTEIYGFVPRADMLSALLADHTDGSTLDLAHFGYQKSGLDALRHLFKVAAGLDSQILGDYEILGQLKRSADLAKSYELIGPLMARVLNFVFQASKKIKTETSLSQGTVSVSFAAVNVLQTIPDLPKKKVVLLGTGKFGTDVCNNLKEYFKQIDLTVINRTDDVALRLAQRINARHCLYGNRRKAIDDADVVIVCTNAQEYTVSEDMVNTAKQQLYLDLSVPVNVDPNIKKKEHIRIIDVDEISSSILDKTLAARKAELPKAMDIINHYIGDFLNWVGEYRYALHLKTWKEKLINLSPGQGCEFANDKFLPDDHARTQQAKCTLKRLAVNLKERKDKGCLFINSINDYLDNGHVKN